MYTTIISLDYRKSSYIKCKKVFGEGEDKVHAFGPVDISINSGEFVSVLGPSDQVYWPYRLFLSDKVIVT